MKGSGWSKKGTALNCSPNKVVGFEAKADDGGIHGLRLKCGKV